MKCGFDQLRSEMKSDIVWMKWAIGAILALSVGTIASVISGTIARTLSPRGWNTRNTCLR